MELKIGDHVKVKEGTTLETGEVISNWAGEVKEVYLKYRTCLIELDSITLNSLEDEYLLEALEEGEDAFEYIFAFRDLEISKRRDSENERTRTREIIDERMLELSNAEEQQYYRMKEKWIDKFMDSDFFDGLNDEQKQDAEFIADSFMDCMYSYEYVQPKEWTHSNVSEVCLRVIPKKITAEIEFFENYGDVLIIFFKFLEEKGYVTGSKKLQDTVLKIKRQIPKEAQNPDNWGMAKSFMMQAQNEGYDVSSQEGLDAFTANFNKGILSEGVNAKGIGSVKPAETDLFKNIGRNEKITVKYTDGTLKKGIKFKKVERDLRDGRCELQ